MRVKTIIVAVFALALLAALIIPGTQEIASYATRSMVQSYIYPKDEQACRMRFANRHKADPVILQGAAEGIDDINNRIKLYESALKLRPSDPSLHAGIISSTMHVPYPCLMEGLPPTPSSTDMRYLKIMEERAAAGAKYDPDNAFFYYTLACARVALGDKAEAKKLFITASHKPRFEPYVLDAKHAFTRANLAQGMARLESQEKVIEGLDQPFVGAFSRLSKRMVKEARQAQAEGRSSDALALDLAAFRTGEFLVNSCQDEDFITLIGFDIMLRTCPQIPKQKLKAIEKAEGSRKIWLGAQLGAQWPVTEKYLSSNSVPRVEIERMHDSLLAINQRALAYIKSSDVEKRLGDAYSRGYLVLAIVFFPMACAVGFGLLWLALKPLVRLLMGSTETTGWSAWTSAELWILLLAPLVALSILLGKASGATEGFYSLSECVNSMDPGEAVLTIAFIPLVIGLLMLGGTIISMLSRNRRFTGRKYILDSAVLLALTALLTCWMWKVDLGLVIGFLQIGLILMLIFSLLRGWVVNRHVPGLGSVRHFLTSLLASFRTVAVGTAAFFAVSLYLALPWYNQAVRFMDQWLMKGKGSFLGF